MFYLIPQHGEIFFHTLRCWCYILNLIRRSSSLYIFLQAQTLLFLVSVTFTRQSHSTGRNICILSFYSTYTPYQICRAASITQLYSRSPHNNHDDDGRRQRTLTARRHFITNKPKTSVSCIVTLWVYGI